MGSGLTPEQNRIFSDIRQYLEDARSITLTPSRYDRDRRNFYALAMVLFALANRLIDLGGETVYSRGYAAPDEDLKNKVIFKRLSDHQVIDLATRQDLIHLVDFRNRCSHHFHEVSKEDLIMVMDALPRYESFVITMREELSRTSIISRRQAMIIAGIILLVCVILLVLFFS
ncbi:MAG TPA: HepT-like ribonuclease domain-containing protein [Methanospirillum sp.]|nr:HepT-like ribonuclease domain-containing protein [Methanospirillum sp.]